ncbi:MAG: putative two-component histidine kinase [Gemmatimonadetes bacterium]|nr:putative two-component histidine kinase [Gemmatimonadota bacterium]
MLAPAAVAVALLAASAWLAEPWVGYLAVCLIATLAGAIVLKAQPGRTGRIPLMAALLALAGICAVGGRAQTRLARFSRSPAEVGSEEAAAQRSRLQNRVDEELRTLRDVARRARTLPASSREAVSQLERLVGDVEHRGVLVLHGDTLIAWAGTLHADPGRLLGTSGIVASPFGLTVYVASDSAQVRTVVFALLYAASPADRLTRGLAQRLASDEITEGFLFAPPSGILNADELQYVDEGRPLFVARAIVPSPGEVRFRLLERARVRAGIALLVALIAFLVGVAGSGTSDLAVVAGALVVLRCLALVPLSEFSTRSRLFDASVYFYPAGHAYTANAGALALTSAIAVLLVLLAVRRVGARMPRLLAGAVAAITIVIGPFAIRSLSRGIAPATEGAGGGLWIIWTIPLCLAATALLALATWAGRRALGARRGAPIMTGPALALVGAIIAPIIWEAPGQWPQWFSLIWAAAVAAVVLSRPSHRTLLACATVAALASTTVVWGSESRGRVELAERDARGLSAPDAYADTLGQRLARSMQGEDIPRTVQALLERYVTSDLASAGYPVALYAWSYDQQIAHFGSAPFGFPFRDVSQAADSAMATGQRVVSTAKAGVYGVHIVAVPMRGGVVTIVIAPRTRLIGTDAYARWYGLAGQEGNEPPYTVQVISDTFEAGSSTRWRREGNELHGDWPVNGAGGPARAHLEVDLRRLDSLLPRGGLLVIVNLGVVWLVWLVGASTDGRVGRWLRLRRRRIRSYRAQLSVALFLFFLVPAAAFAVWSWQQLFDDAQASRRLLVTETMRAFNPGSGLAGESRRLDTKLLLYQSGVLVDASDSLFADLIPMGRLLRPEVAVELTAAEELGATKAEPLDGATGMMGYRVLPGRGGRSVLAAPARVDDFLLDRRRRDLGVLVLFATALGATAALWLSAIAARQLARPISALRSAARAVARGESDLPFDGRASSEFLPVFTAFRAMARDLGESRAALVEAQRRTDAVLRTVASGVIAVDENGRVILANPRAEALLGSVPAAGDGVGSISLPAVATRLAGFLAGSQEFDGFDLVRDGRTLRGQFTRLSRGGAVLTLDDVTELARAQRVLAWGEMARQVAHEIKNPLTPIRLGVQHLRRAFGRPKFEEVLDQNVTRILTEIDRLDEIARAFSRYGGGPEQRAPAVPTDIVATVKDVVALETLGEGQVSWRCIVMGDIPHAMARPDELREVLLNLFENARLANAQTVVATVQSTEERVRIDVADDGAGIAADVLPKIFEPHFSTRTSGSGLGLAITRRMVDGWGGSVSIESSSGAGTVVRVELKKA